MQSDKIFSLSVESPRFENLALLNDNDLMRHVPQQVP